MVRFLQHQLVSIFSKESILATKKITNATKGLKQEMLIKSGITP
jgi:hypothetical protein